MVLEALIEADGDIDLGSLIRRGETTRERSRRDGKLLHSAFDEVARGRRFGEHDEIGLGIEPGGLRDDGADAGHILRVLALGRAELRECDANGRHMRKIVVSLQQVMEFASNRHFPADDSYPNYLTAGVFSLTILYIALGGIAGTPDDRTIPRRAHPYARVHRRE